MIRRPPIARCIAILLAAVLLAPLGARLAHAQDQGQAAAPAARARGPAPVMENVFYNVVWGSAVGVLLGLASAVEGSRDKSNPDNARGAAFQGATIGGVVGLGVGVWLVYAGITFEPAGSTITDTGAAPGADPVVFQPKDLLPAPGAAPQPAIFLAQAAAPPFMLETAPGQPGKIIGFRALLMDLRF